MIKFRGEHEPTAEEAAIAEGLMSEGQKIESAELERAYDSMQPPRFDEKSGSILFDLNRELVQTERLKPILAKQGYEPKNEFHVTIFGFKKGRIIKDALAAMSAEQRNKKTLELRELIDKTDWSLASTPKLYKVSKEYSFRDNTTGQQKKSMRETIVQALDLKELEQFSDSLSAIVGKKIEPQFPHLTLFTKGTDADSKMGIGIDTFEDFQKLNPKPLEI